MKKAKFVFTSIIIVISFCLTILTSCSYFPSQGSNSPDGMKAGIKVNGKYYEGVEENTFSYVSAYIQKMKEQQVNQLDTSSILS